MRKKNPNFNEDNKKNRSDSDSSSNQRSSGGRRASRSTGGRRSNADDDKKGRDGKSSRGNHRGSRSANTRDKYSKDRKPYGRENADRNSGNSDSTRAEKPFSAKRRGNSSPSKPDATGLEGRPFHEKRTSSDQKKPFRVDRPDRGDTDRKPSARPFTDKRRGEDRDGSKPFAGKRRSTDDASEKRPFRIDKPESKEGVKGVKPLGEKRKLYKKFRVNKRRPEEITPDDGLIRLNKYVANAGICSRREADEYIKTGVVEVNGVTITEMGFKVKAEDDVRFDGERISPERKAYVLLNKPKGFITTTKDEKERKTVMELVANATSARLFPVGRLDRQTTGVLLFTNDGHLAKKLTHPSHGVKKIYHVMLDRDLHGDDMEKIRNGIAMQEGVAKVDKISFIDNKPHNEVGVEIHIGWNRVVRRIFEKLGYKIVALDRVEFAGLTKKSLKRGDYRILGDKEVSFLKII